MQASIFWHFSVFWSFNNYDEDFKGVILFPKTLTYLFAQTVLQQPSVRIQKRPAICSSLLYEYRNALQFAAAFCTNTETPCNLQQPSVSIQKRPAICSSFLYQYRNALQFAAAFCMNTESPNSFAKNFCKK
jgi:hypothetical protein